METFSGKMFMAKAKRVFLNPEPLYDYNSIVQGCSVKDNENNGLSTMYAIDRSIWRGFRKVDEYEDGAKYIYVQYFLDNKVKIIDKLMNINTVNELNKFSNELCSELHDLLSNNVLADKLVYNRIRVPVDLFIEHVVAMARELSECRKKLVPLLFVPLDEHSIKNCFQEKDLFKNSYKFISTIGDIDSPEEYDRLQDILFNKAKARSKELGQPYYRIYSEMLWHDRFKDTVGGNLFETNLHGINVLRK